MPVACTLTYPLPGLTSLKITVCGGEVPLRDRTPYSGVIFQIHIAHRILGAQGPTAACHSGRFLFQSKGSDSGLEDSQCDGLPARAVPGECEHEQNIDATCDCRVGVRQNVILVEV